jgi:hypothetical protein
MADMEDGKTNPNNDDVFVNGESDSSRSNTLLHPEYGGVPGQVLPRRSSLIKDPNRRKDRKKTVSFSSMPNERSVINGECHASSDHAGLVPTGRSVAVIW